MPAAVVECSPIHILIFIDSDDKCSAIPLGNYDRPEPSRVAMLVRIDRFTEREHFDHAANVVELGEFDCVLTVLRCAAKVSVDGPLVWRQPS